MNNSAVGFLLVPLQKQIETAPHPQRQVADAKIFNLLQQPSYMRRQYIIHQTGKRMERLPTQACN